MTADPDLVESISDESRLKQTSLGGRDLLIGIGIIWGFEILLGVAIVLWGGTSIQLVEHPVVILLTTLASSSLTLLLVWFLTCKKYGKSISAGFLISRPSRKCFIASLAIGIGYGLLAIALLSSYSTGRSMFAEMAKSPVGLSCMIIMALLLPVAEEVYYRGFIFPVLQSKWGPSVAVTVVTLWFGTVHVFQNTSDWLAIPVIAVGGGIFTIQRSVTGNLVPSFVSHWSYNFCMVASSLLAVLTE